ncbi:MAG: hypothetical protein H7831_08695 [Magnetococcus sp. WYHC-3]
MTFMKPAPTSWALILVAGLGLAASTAAAEWGPWNGPTPWNMTPGWNGPGPGWGGPGPGWNGPGPGWGGPGPGWNGPGPQGPWGVAPPSGDPGAGPGSYAPAPGRGGMPPWMQRPARGAQGEFQDGDFPIQQGGMPGMSLTQALLTPERVQQMTQALRLRPDQGDEWQALVAALLALKPGEPVTENAAVKETFAAFHATLDPRQRSLVQMVRQQLSQASLILDRP